MIPGRISGWHINPKDPSTVIGYRANEHGLPQPFTTIVAEVPGYNVERERIAKVIAASEEAEDLIVTLQRALPRTEEARELRDRCAAYLKSIR